MTVFESLNFNLKEVNEGKKNYEDYYKLLLENGVLLSKAQFLEILSESKKIKIETPQIKALQSLAESLYIIFYSNEENVLEKLNDSFENFEIAGDLQGKAAADILKAMHYKNSGQLDKAQSFLQTAFETSKGNTHYHYIVAVGYYQAGEIHVLLKDFEAALNYFNIVLNLPNLKSNLGTRALNAIGTVYVELGNFEMAIGYFQKSMDEIKDSGNIMLKSKIFADVANYYFRTGDVKNSLEYHTKSIDLRKEHKFINPLITNYAELAELYLSIKDYNTALTYAKEAEKMAEELNIKIKLYGIYKVLSLIYEAQNNIVDALAYCKKFQICRDEVLSQENSRKIKQLTMNYQMETIQKEKEIFTLRNVELKSAIEEIEASVRYAKRIQNAILPSEKVIKKHLPNSFVLYKPKDIVAGDFFWIEQKNDSVVFAAADCTGHGVPGALVSVICNNGLNRNLHEKGILIPGKILDYTRENIIQQFEMSEDNVKDGMDISLCVLNTNVHHNQLMWAGANNPLWIIRKGNLIEYAPDKQPIGNFENPKPFTTHTITLEKGDTLYLFTDGFQDQFGGSAIGGKKFKVSRFKELLLSIQNETMENQKLLLDAAFENWKGKLEQVDDICVIGVRI